LCEYLANSTLNGYYLFIKYLKGFSFRAVWFIVIAYVVLQRMLTVDVLLLQYMSEGEHTFQLRQMK